MENTFSNLVSILSLVILLEILLQVFWVRYYFLFGIRIFKISMDINCDGFEIPIMQLNKKGKANPNQTFIPSIEFHSFNPKDCAFRESRWLPSLYIPIIRGRITYDNKSKKISFRYYLNNSPTLMLIVNLLYWWRWGGFETNEFSTIIFYIFLFSFTVQALRFSILTMDCRKYFLSAIKGQR